MGGGAEEHGNEVKLVKRYHCLETARGKIKN